MEDILDTDTIVEEKKHPHSHYKYTQRNIKVRQEPKNTMRERDVYEEDETEKRKT